MSGIMLPMLFKHISHKLLIITGAYPIDSETALANSDK